VRFTRSEVRLLLDQSRRLLLEVASEQHRQTTVKQLPPTIPTLKRCTTEIHGFVPPVDEGYVSNEEEGEGSGAKKLQIGAREA
jgi:hypothetical protein